MVYRLVPVGKLKDDGWRSQVSRELFKQMAENAGFKVLRQTDSWGKNGRYNCRLSRDMISVLAK